MFLRLVLLLITISTPVWAATPKAIEDYFKQENPKAQIRLDGLLQVGDKLWLPFEAATIDNGSSAGINLVLKTKDEDYLFSNGWIYVPVKDNTVKSFDYYDEKIQAQILLNQVTQSFLIPKGFTLPRDLAITAGRLPIELRTVELASDREVKFKERLLHEQNSKPLSLLSYSAASGAINKLELSTNGSASTKVTKLEDLTNTFAYLSNIKTIQSKIYFVDYTKGKLYQLNQTKHEYDARKPLQELVSEPQVEEYKVEELLSISDYDVKTGLQDFTLSDDYTTAYLLTNVDPKLLIVDLRSKKLIKAITVAPGGSNLIMVSRNSSEPTKLYMISKSNSKVTVVNTFDYRISSELDLNKLSEDKNIKYIPHSLAVTASNIFVGVEAVNKKTGQAEGQILVLDAISSALTATLKLEYIPYKLSLAGQANTLYALGSSNTGSYISQISTEPLVLVHNAALGPDIIDSKNFHISDSGSFVLIPSAGTNIIGVLDTASWQLVHKIDIGDKSNILISL